MTIIPYESINARHGSDLLAEVLGFPDLSVAGLSDIEFLALQNENYASYGELSSDGTQLKVIKQIDESDYSWAPKYQIQLINKSNITKPPYTPTILDTYQLSCDLESKGDIADIIITPISNH